MFLLVIQNWKFKRAQFVVLAIFAVATTFLLVANAKRLDVRVKAGGAGQQGLSKQ